METINRRFLSHYWSDLKGTVVNRGFNVMVTWNYKNRLFKQISLRKNKHKFIYVISKTHSKDPRDQICNPMEEKGWKKKMISWKMFWTLDLKLERIFNTSSLVLSSSSSRELYKLLSNSNLVKLRPTLN